MTVVLNKFVDAVAVGFGVGENFEVALLNLEPLGNQTLFDKAGQVKGGHRFSQGNIEMQPAATAGANRQGSSNADRL